MIVEAIKISHHNPNQKVETINILPRRKSNVITFHILNPPFNLPLFYHFLSISQFVSISQFLNFSVSLFNCLERARRGEPRGALPAQTAPGLKGQIQ